MLPDPPCIDRLYGCSSTDLFSRSGAGGTGDGGSTTGGALGGGTSGSFRNTTQSSSSSSRAGSSILSNIGRTGSSALNTATSKAAKYLLSVKNTGSIAVNNAKVLHGPLPFGATFNPSRSSQGCVLVGKTVECTLSLLPGESKDVTLHYDASGVFSCAIAKLLQSARSTIGALSGAQNPVTVSVKCSMENTANAASISGQDTSNVAGIVGSGGTFIAGMKPGEMKPIETKPIPSYKPYPEYKYIPPRTGASMEMYLEDENQPFLTPFSQQEESLSIGVQAIFLLSVASIVMIWKCRRKLSF